MTKHLALSPAFAAAGDASFRPPPFSFAPASSGSPLAAILHRTFRSKAAAAVGLPAASGSQTAQTGAEPKPATASEQSDVEEQWEVVPGAEHLKQLKDAKARLLSEHALSKGDLFVVPQCPTAWQPLCVDEG